MINSGKQLLKPTLIFKEEDYERPDDLEQFFIKAYRQCEEYYSSDKISCFNSPPKQIPFHNSCFLVKKQGNKTHDIFTSMCVSSSDSGPKKQTTNFKYKDGNWPSGYKIRIIELKNADYAFRHFQVNKIKGYYIVHTYSPSNNIHQEDQQQLQEQQQDINSNIHPMNINQSNGHDNSNIKQNAKYPSMFMNNQGIGIPGIYYSQGADGQQVINQMQGIQNIAPIPPIVMQNSPREIRYIFNQEQQQANQNLFYQPQQQQRVNGHQQQQSFNQQNPSQEQQQQKLFGQNLQNLFEQEKEKMIKHFDEKYTALTQIVQRQSYQEKQLQQIISESLEKDNRITALELYCEELFKKLEQQNNQIVKLQEAIKALQQQKGLPIITDNIPVSFSTQAVSIPNMHPNCDQQFQTPNQDQTQRQFFNTFQQPMNQFKVINRKEKTSYDLQQEEIPIRKQQKIDYNTNTNLDVESQTNVDNRDIEDSRNTNYMNDIDQSSPQFEEFDQSTTTIQQSHFHFDKDLYLSTSCNIKVGFFTSSEYSNFFSSQNNKRPSFNNLSMIECSSQSILKNYEQIEEIGLVGWIQPDKISDYENFSEVVNQLKATNQCISYQFDENTHLVLFPKELLTSYLDVDISYTKGMPLDKEILTFWWYYQ